MSKREVDDGSVPDKAGAGGGTRAKAGDKVGLGARAGGKVGNDAGGKNESRAKARVRSKAKAKVAGRVKAVAKDKGKDKAGGRAKVGGKVEGKDKAVAKDKGKDKDKDKGKGKDKAGGRAKVGGKVEGKDKAVAKDKGKDKGKRGSGKRISDKRYERELARQQIELVKLQEWVKQTGRRVVIIFEGRDAAGKGGTIKRITEPLNPRICQVVALPAPTEREQTQWYFQRYVAHLPAAGEIVILDRSWYNRAGVERVMGFCTEEEYQEFLRSCPEFERMLVRSGIQLIKYWFSVSDEEQERRFQKRLDDPTRRWKLSPMDLESRNRWADYSRAKDEMFAHTDIAQAPWYVVASDVKKHARLNCIAHLLSLIPYEDQTPEPIELGERPLQEDYERPPIDEQTFVPEIHDRI